jgi:hypothetical protein
MKSLICSLLFIFRIQEVIGLKVSNKQVIIKENDSDPYRDFYELNNRRVDPLRPEPIPPKKETFDFNMKQAQSNYTYKEADNFIEYKVITPPFPNWVHLNDIEVHLHTKMLIIRAIGSGSSFNKLVKPNYINYHHHINIETTNKNYDYMRRINVGSKLKNN